MILRKHNTGFRTSQAMTHCRYVNKPISQDTVAPSEKGYSQGRKVKVLINLTAPSLVSDVITYGKTMWLAWYKAAIYHEVVWAHESNEVKYQEIACVRNELPRTCCHSLSVPFRLGLEVCYNRTSKTCKISQFVIWLPGEWESGIESTLYVWPCNIQ